MGRIASDGGYATIVEALLASPEPSIRWKVRTRVLDEAPDSPSIVALREEIRGSERVRRLLAPSSSTEPARRVQQVAGRPLGLAALADLGYPPGDPALRQLREQILETWLAVAYYTEFEATARSAAYRRPGVPVMRGRHRRCASQQGNALSRV